MDGPRLIVDPHPTRRLTIECNLDTLPRAGPTQQIRARQVIEFTDREPPQLTPADRSSRTASRPASIEKHPRRTRSAIEPSLAIPSGLFPQPTGQQDPHQDHREA